jgi:hypothetical protein
VWPQVAGAEPLYILIRRVPLDKNEGVVKVHESGHVPQAR